MLPRSRPSTQMKMLSPKHIGGDGEHAVFQKVWHKKFHLIKLRSAPLIKLQPVPFVPQLIEGNQITGHNLRRRGAGRRRFFSAPRPLGTVNLPDQYSIITDFIVIAFKIAETDPVAFHFKSGSGIPAAHKNISARKLPLNRQLSCHPKNIHFSISKNFCPTFLPRSL